MTNQLSGSTFNYTGNANTLYIYSSNSGINIYQISVGNSASENAEGNNEELLVVEETTEETTEEADSITEEIADEETEESVNESVTEAEMPAEEYTEEAVISYEDTGLENNYITDEEITEDVTEITE